MRVHVTRSGDPGVCSAQPGNCPLSDDEGHYSSPEEARLAYENENAGDELPPAVKRGGPWSSWRSNRPIASI